MGGGFKRSEVTVTRLGTSPSLLEFWRTEVGRASSPSGCADELSFLSDRAEETEHLIGLASDWLELDSPDEGIRFDSELVRGPALLAAGVASLADSSSPALRAVP
jgi:hypothetical protein